MSNFSDKFGLVGDTAIALQVGHRRSMDFDLITKEDLDHAKIMDTIRSQYSIESVIVDEKNELSVVINSVKLTFLKYPFEIEHKIKYGTFVNMSDILSLASMKAYALGRRAKWKDYVDLYFIFNKHSFGEVIEKTKEIFKSEFNEKQFGEQLSYFEDIDHTERVDYLKGQEKSDEEIKRTLVELSV